MRIKIIISTEVHPIKTNSPMDKNSAMANFIIERIPEAGVSSSGASGVSLFSVSAIEIFRSVSDLASYLSRNNHFTYNYQNSTIFGEQSSSPPTPNSPRKPK